MVDSKTVTLESLRGVGSGKAFIVGCGPSLLGQDLSFLRNEVTFCCNRFDLWKDSPFVPTHYFCAVKRVREGLEPSNPRRTGHRFISYRNEETIDGWVPVKKRGNVPIAGLGDDINVVATGGSQVLIMAQVAVWMGYRTLRLLGCEQTEIGHVWDVDDDRRKYTAAASINVEGVLSEFARMKREYGDAVDIKDCTPGGRLNDILGYEPLA